MKKIRILGTKPFGHFFPLISWLIRLVEWSDQSHVVWEFTDDKKVFHAHFNEIVYEDYDEFMKKNTITDAHEFEISDIEYNILMAYKNQVVGKQKGYFKTLIGNIIPQALRTISNNKIMLDNMWPRGITCSWHIFRCADVIGFRHGQIARHYCFDKGLSSYSMATDDSLAIAKKFVDENKEQV